MTMAGYRFDLPAANGAAHRPIFPADLRVACLWSALGLTLTGLMFAAGFGVEIAQALMAAG